jgi:hypothetical protein
VLQRALICETLNNLYQVLYQSDTGDTGNTVCSLCAHCVLTCTCRGLLIEPMSTCAQADSPSVQGGGSLYIGSAVLTEVLTGRVPPLGPPPPPPTLTEPFGVPEMLWGYLVGGAQVAQVSPDMDSTLCALNGFCRM